VNEIVCPHCKKAFKIDEAGFADILKQVRDHEFERELHERAQMYERDKESAVKLAEVKTKGELQSDLAKKDAELAELKAIRDAEIAELKAERDARIAELKAGKDSEITKLEAKIESAETEKKLALNEAVTSIERERDELKMKLTAESAEKQRIELSLKDKYETQLKDRDDAIERLKDLKAKLSVKLVGENLEQHCENEFNNIRVGQFPFAYFEKDNEAVKDDDEVKGTKGDYIYRDYESRGGAEIISIMFEMKDEQDVSINKRTVESHLDKLDKDRKKKGLEYAVLVTLLEAENEFYNQGIVDLSYKYEKMYVIRPQFFLPLISLLKNANMKSADDKRQLAIARNSNVDIENFVSNVENWKSGWANNMKNAAKKHSEAIDQIDKAIKDLQKVRDALTTSDKHLLAAENKMDDLTIKRLTKNSPSVAARINELNK
jgi:hypothetical protein